MKWSNLKLNKCPSCNKDWLKANNAQFVNGMILCKCGFKISEKKMAIIINDKVEHELDEDYIVE